MITRAIILCAGRNLRMGSSVGSIPKCLIPLNSGICPLGWTLDLLCQSGIRELYIVTGYESSQIESFVGNYRSMYTIHLIYNPRYTELDTAYSFWLSASLLSQSYLLLYGDTMCSYAVISELCASENQNLLVVDSSREVACMDMKVSIHQDNTLHRINKELSRYDISGEAACIYVINQAANKVLCWKYESRHKWFEDILQDVVSDRMCSFTAIQCNSSEWVEIDMEKDIARANTFLSCQLEQLYSKK